MTKYLLLLFFLSCVPKPENYVPGVSDQNNTDNSSSESTSEFSSNPSGSNLFTNNFQAPNFDMSNLTGLSVKDFTSLSTQAFLYYKSKRESEHILDTKGIIDNSNTTGFILEASALYDTSNTTIWNATNLGIIATTNPDLAVLSQIHFLYFADQMIHYLHNFGPNAYGALNYRITFNTTEMGFRFGNNMDLFLRTFDQNGFQILDQTIGLYLFTQSLMGVGSSGELFNPANLMDYHKDCGPLDGPKYKLHCCSWASKGCSKAVNSGIAQMMVARLFPSARPLIGDTYFMNDSGRKICDKYQNLSDFRIYNAFEAYELCRASGDPGNIEVMGTFFGSVLYAVYDKIKNDSAKVQTFDTILVGLFNRVHFSDTFKSVLDKIQTMAPSSNRDIIYLHLQQEMSNRGIDLMD